MWNKIALLGATGSIGTQTLDVLKKNQMLDKVVLLSAYRNLDALNRISAICPNATLCLMDEHLPLKENVELYSGFEGLVEALEKLKPDLTIVAVSGAAGFKIALESIKNTTRRVCLATKEALVIGGKFVKQELKERGIELLPIDSEHSALFQLLLNENVGSVNKIILTASGGALRDYPLEKFDSVSAKDVLKHPVWNMGRRITVDSATMVNKAFEVIEAHHLFDVEIDKITAMIHREGLIHSMVEFVDGSIKLHVGYPDMRIPISYSIFFPNRMKFDADLHIDFKLLEKLHLEEPSPERYPAFFMVYDLFKMPSSGWIVYNASDEVAVQKFLDGKIKFTDIFKLISKTIERFDHFEPETPEEVVSIDLQARKMAEEEVEKWA
ncbi:MAG: 1-deoxy-D-xylulose-5-phosphate reductoisomerase [Thermotogaceae bacterium]|jgi:1-deoxy-D-xylulose-5-phosphate reductoisomerase|nr:1-deoxy-D-xylulose-5-phosphate reductoisomerase [Thermotogaceae bacterium]MDN5337454.1 1-deoxy-D-xylulose-5-phosphate reductoisomerase [Thermotogaceae bacterium]